MSGDVRRIWLAGLLVTLALGAAAALVIMRPAAAATGSVTAHVGSSLGDDVFQLAAFEGRESISQLFSYQLDLVSSSPSVSPSSVIGTAMTVSVVGDGDERTFGGVVASFTFAGPSDLPGFDRYRAIVVPEAWLLTQTADLRIFQDATARDIVTAVLDEFDVDEVDYRLSDTYPTRECTVQYRETDFAFVSRLMADEGIYFAFDHDARGSRLIIADTNPASPGPEVSFGDDIEGWLRTMELTPGRVTLRDWDFTAPEDDLTASADSLRSDLAPERYEVYDFPGEYAQRFDGARKARLRVGELDAGREVAIGDGSVLAFSPGRTFTLDDHPRASENGQYLLTSVIHRIVPTEGGDLEYSNTFEAIPTEVPFRPPRTTPRPVVHGPQTAIVVGPAGEETWTDQHGRVKVQFHWDRVGTSDENSSCWIRVAQNWAGGRWGATFIPRIGSEVVVDFLEGDPDRPLITGRVYNADLAPPHRWKPAR